MNARTARLDRLELEIAGARRLQTRATIATLEAAGFDASGIRPLAFPHPSESHAAQHARGVELARADYLEHGPPRRTMGGAPLLARRAVGRVLRVS